MGTFRDSELAAPKAKPKAGTYRQMDMAEENRRKRPASSMFDEGRGKGLRALPGVRVAENLAGATGDTFATRWQEFGHGVAEDYRRQSDRRGRTPTPKEQVQDFGSAGMHAVRLGQAVLSPLEGATNALVIKPAGAVAARWPLLPTHRRTSDGRVERMNVEEAREYNRGQAEKTAGLALSAVRPVPGTRPGALSPTPVPTQPKPTRSALTPEARGTNALAKRANLDPAAMRAEADRMRAAGVTPTLTDVAGERGRRVIRAVGAKSPEAGEALVGRAKEVSTTAKPAVMSRTRAISKDPRTANELDAAIRAERDSLATKNYAEPYRTQVQVPDSVKDMLSDASGRSIIARARADAIENQDWMQQAELDSLLQVTKDGRLPRVSAGTVDRLVIAARERGAKFAERGNGSRARGAFGRQRQLDAVLGDVAELKPARADYRAKSQAIDVLGKKRLDVFSTDPTDYRSWIQSLSPEAREANKVAIRQEIVDTLGGQRGSTMGTIDDVATSAYARDNLAAALGDQEASNYIVNLTARLDQVRNARFVSPNDGSRTGVLDNDTSALEGFINTVGAVNDAHRGNVLGLGVRLADWLRRRGFSEEMAKSIAQASSDERALDRIIAQLEAAAPGMGREYLSVRQALIVGVAAQPRALPSSQLAIPAAATRPEDTEARR